LGIKIKEATNLTKAFSGKKKWHKKTIFLGDFKP
jgi:hypothetical protein